MSTTQTILVKVKKDERYKTFKKIVEQVQGRVDFETARNEAVSLHSGLIVRTLYGKKQFSPKTIIESVAQVQANRSRLVELRSKSQIHLSYLDEAAEAFKRYLMTQYADDLAGFRTKDQRDALLDRIMAKAQEILAEGKGFNNLLDGYIKDLDQAGYTHKALVDLLQMLEAKGSQIV